MPSSRVSPARKVVDRSPVPADFEEAAEIFALLAAPHRVRLLWLLARGEHDVTSLAEQVSASVATVSQHLAKLRLADLVTARREGRRQLYRVDDPHVVALVNQAVDHAAEERRH